MAVFRNEQDKKEVLEALQLNMNEELRATLQYICHRISAKGPDPELAEMFKSAALDEMSHILFFSDLITRSGGTPAFTTWESDQSSEIKKMLEKDIQLEQAAKKRYALQIEQFKDYPELSTILASVLSDEEDHEEQFSRYASKKP